MAASPRLSDFQLIAVRCQWESQRAGSGDLCVTCRRHSVDVSDFDIERFAMVTVVKLYLAIEPNREQHLLFDLIYLVPFSQVPSGQC